MSRAPPGARKGRRNVTVQLAGGSSASCPTLPTLRVATPASSSFDPANRVGEVVAGKYRLERLLGVGGMGAVYEAVHTGVQRRFALKIMTVDPERTPDAVRRFTQEAQAAGLIGHPHIVEVFDLGESSDGSLFMVMELLRGETLHELLRRGPLPAADAVTIALELLRALDAAHRVGIIHRDIKPQNLFLATRPGVDGATLKVLDFGIAKFHEADGASAVTRSGAIMGTPLYMAPEQVLSDRDIDGRADVWAVGATLFEMLVGRPVHLAPHAAAAAVRIVTERAPRVRTLRADVDPELEDVVARALTISRDERFASAADMIAALESIAARLPPSEVGAVMSPSSGVPRLPSMPNGGRASAGDGHVPPSPPDGPPRDRDTKRGGSARSALIIFGALALVGGATAGTLLLPVGSAPSDGVRPTAPPAVSTPRAVFDESVGAAASAPAPANSAVVTRPTGASSSSGTLAEPGVSSTPLGAAGGHHSPGKAGDLRKDEHRRGTESAPGPAASAPASAATSVPSAQPAASCGPREALSSGHCCPIGMVWQSDHCDRPVATSF